MTPDEAADLAARTLTLIRLRETDRRVFPLMAPAHFAADRERVESDLRLLGNAYWMRGTITPTLFDYLTDHAADGLRRTARLYGVEA